MPSTPWLLSLVVAASWTAIVALRDTALLEAAAGMLAEIVTVAGLLETALLTPLAAHSLKAESSAVVGVTSTSAARSKDVMIVEVVEAEQGPSATELTVAKSAMVDRWWRLCHVVVVLLSPGWTIPSAVPGDSARDR